MENSTVFNDVKATIQHKIKYFLQSYKNKVVAQVSEVPFIVIIAYETTDVSVQINYHQV